MKLSEKRNLLILIVIGIIIIVILASVNGKKSKENPENNTANIDANKTVTELQSGTKLNISEKLAEKKYFANFEVSNIQLTEKDDKTKFSADIKNTSETKTEMTNLEVTFYDQEGNELTTVKDALIAEIEPDAKTKLNFSTTLKCVEAYNFSIKIAEGGEANEAK